MYPPNTDFIDAADGPPGILAAVNHKALVVMEAGPNMTVLEPRDPTLIAFNKNVPAEGMSSTRSTRIRTSYVCKALMASIWPGLLCIEVVTTSTPN